MIRRPAGGTVGALVLLALAGCAGVPAPAPVVAPPAPPQAVCPPDFAPGGPYYCAPKPKPSFCTTIPQKILHLNDGTIAHWAMSEETRAGIRNAMHSLQDFCGVPETVHLSPLPARARKP